MRSNKLIMIVLSVFFILSAEETYKVDIDSKGVKTFYNKKPADPNFRIDLTKIGEISAGQLDSLDVNKFYVYDFDIDSEGNLIILDHNKMWKFSRSGRYINTWSRQGNGPGEFRNPMRFYMLNDTIHVLNSPKIIKFDSDGNFIDNIIIENYSDFPKDIFTSNGNFLIGSKMHFDLETFMKTDKIVTYDIKTLSPVKTLFERKYKKKGSMFSRDDYYLYSGNRKEFYIVLNSYDDYKIDCYDSKTGNIKYKIRKNHIRVKNDEEVKNHHGVYNGEKIIITTGDEKLKESINWIYNDKFGRLWVNSNNVYEEEKGYMYFDIFKDGVFLNRVKLDLEYEDDAGFKLCENIIIEFGWDEEGFMNAFIYEFK